MAFPANWSIAETTIYGVATEPVATSDIKQYARVDTAADDTLIGALAAAARTILQDETHRQLRNQTLVMYADSWPPMSASLTLPRPPLQTVSTVEYVATSATSPSTYTTFASSNYVVAANETPGRLRLMPNTSWPDLADVPQAVKVTFVAGTTLTLDDRTQLAIKMLATHFYENRTPTGGAERELPYGLKMLIASQRWGSIH